MNPKIKRLGALAGASVCSLALIPAVATANPSSDVRKQIEGADGALVLAIDLAGANEDAAAALELARANVAARKANAAARRVRGAEAAAKARRLVASQFNENAEIAANLIGELDGSAQGDVATLIEVAVQGRAKAVATLTALLDRVPPDAVQGLSRAIAAITADRDAAEALGQALAGGEIASSARARVEEALRRVTAAFQNAVAQLEGVIGHLPPQAQPHVQAAIDQIGTSFDTVVGVLGGLLGGGGSAPGGGAGAGPGAPQVPGLPSFLGGLLPSS